MSTSEAPLQPHGEQRCITCGRSSHSMQREWFECSHIDCPERRPITAAPRDVAPREHA